MENKHKRINIVAEKDALIQLCFNKEFQDGKNLKHIFRNLADILLIMDQDEFDADWNNPESDLREFFAAYDMPNPRVFPELKQIYRDPRICSMLDQFALWLFNKPKDVQNLRNYIGIWALNPMSLSDDYFCIEHHHQYDKGDIIEGSKCNGWGNFLEKLPKELPPFNSIVLNDRYLLFNTNENNALKNGFYGLNNLKILFNELLPRNLIIPFHILIFCQHPKKNIKETDKIVNQFIQDVKGLRGYTIEIEFVYDVSRHKRNMFSNYFRIWADRGYNAFKNSNTKILCGENDFKVVTYLNNPFASGETEYDSARSIINKIQKQCNDVCEKPEHNPTDKDGIIHEEWIKRVVRSDEDSYKNRLFS